MSMRSQVYEWSNLAASGQTSSLRRTVDAVPVVIPTNREYDIFIGGIGNNITKPAETTATQFIVIEDIACSAYLGGALQVRINTTDYFQNPDVTDQAGVPGLASPYPRGSSDSAVTDSITDYVQLLKSFDLYPRCLCASGTGFPNSLQPSIHQRCGGCHYCRCGIREIHPIRRPGCPHRQQTP